MVIMAYQKVLINPDFSPCFDIWGILKLVSVKSVEPGDNSFSLNHIIRCTRSELLPLRFSKFLLVLIV